MVCDLGRLPSRNSFTSFLPKRPPRADDVRIVDTEQLGRSAPDLRTIGRPHMLPGPHSPITWNQYEVEEPPEPSFPYSKHF